MKTDAKKVLRLVKLNPQALKDAVQAAGNSPSATPTAAPRPYYVSY